MLTGLKTKMSTRNKLKNKGVMVLLIAPEE